MFDATEQTTLHPDDLLANCPGFSIGPGAMGTMLQQQGLPLRTGGEAWNLERPETVAAVHQAYAAAGSAWGVANTFGANPARLRLLGLERESGRTNRAAVDIAREAAPNKPVLGSVGPTGAEPGEWSAAYAEQVEALVAAGVDGILVETIISVREGTEAVRQARSAGLSCWAGFTVSAEGTLLDGTSPEMAAEALVQAGARVVGVNCGFGPESLLEAARRLVRAQLAPVYAAPSAGLPVLQGEFPCYPVLPDGFAEAAIQYQDAGVRLFAGCCGTTPSHIRAAILAVQRSSLQK